MAALKRCATQRSSGVALGYPEIESEAWRHPNVTIDHIEE